LPTFFQRSSLRGFTRVLQVLRSFLFTALFFRFYSYCPSFLRSPLVPEPWSLAVKMTPLNFLLRSFPPLWYRSQTVLSSFISVSEGGLALHVFFRGFLPCLCLQAKFFSDLVLYFCKFSPHRSLRISEEGFLSALPDVRVVRVPFAVRVSP